MAKLPALDVLVELKEFSWRGISFPVSEVVTDIEHDVAIHARPDQDSAFLESTGRRPIRISAKCIFRNGIGSGKSETWAKQGPLYPNVYTKFLNAITDRTTGELVHPSLGTVNCKVLNAKATISAEKRDGEDIDVTWSETLTEDNSAFFVAASSITNALSAAAYLDAEKSKLPKTVQAEDPDDLIETFTDAMNQVARVADTVGLIAKQIGGKVDRIVYRAERMGLAIQRLGNPQTWPAQHATMRLIEAARFVQRDLLKKSRTVRIYVNPRVQTVALVAGYLKNTVTDLITLNPSLAGKPFIAEQQVLRYYV